MKRLLKYYSFIRQVLFCIISWIVMDFAVDYKFSQDKCYKLARKGSGLYNFLKSTKIFKGCLASNIFDSNIKMNLCCYYALLTIKIVFQPIDNTINDNNTSPTLTSTKGPKSYSFMLKQLLITMPFLNYAPHKISTERLNEPLIYVLLFFLNLLYYCRRNFPHGLIMKLLIIVIFFH